MIRSIRSTSILALALFSAVCVKAPLLAQTSSPATPGTVSAERATVERQSNGRRVALVIGNANYQAVGQLRNPVNDAQDMANVLTQLGFEVILKTNSSLREMETALDQFDRAIRQGSVGVFYYAGHGVQSQGENYLIPVDAQIEVEQDLRYETLAVGQVLGRMEAAGNEINIVILDACRDNPFGRSWRSTQRGLAAPVAADGVFIAYATAPDRVAADGNGRNGTFTAALLNYIMTPNQQIEQLFNQVGAAVSRETNNAQRPWISSSLYGYFAFRTDSSAPQPASNPFDNLVNPQEVINNFSSPRSPVTIPCAGSVC